MKSMWVVFLFIAGVVSEDHTCPDGKKPVPCLLNPCIKDVTCVNYPQAECVANYCAEIPCLAEWFFEGNKVDCSTPA